MLALQSSEAICRTLGERVRALRLRRNLSQQELARMCGVSLSSVRRLEAQGQGSLLLLVQAAAALGAADALDAWLVEPAQTIAEATRAQQASARRRASKPRQAGD